MQWLVSVLATLSFHYHYHCHGHYRYHYLGELSDSVTIRYPQWPLGISQLSIAVAHRKYTLLDLVFLPLRHPSGLGQHSCCLPHALAQHLPTCKAADDSPIQKPPLLVKPIIMIRRSNILNNMHSYAKEEQERPPPTTKYSRSSTGCYRASILRDMNGKSHGDGEDEEKKLLMMMHRHHDTDVGIGIGERNNRYYHDTATDNDDSDAHLRTG